MYLRKGDADFWLRSCLQCPVFIVRIELGITKSLTTKRCNHHRATFVFDCKIIRFSVTKQYLKVGNYAFTTSW